MTAERARWYVVQTQMNAEHKAAANLARQGFDCYLPRYLKRRRHARKVETVAAPLFPRYMFVAVGDSQPWRSIRSTIGVSHLVCRGDEPTPVPDGVVDQIRGREGEDGFIKLDERPAFAAGDKVRVLEGAFAGCVALCEGMAPNDRVMILLDLLGRKARVIAMGDTLAAA